MEKVKKSQYPHKVGDYVIYRNNGICKIVDIRKENFARIGEKTYYVMNTIQDENSLIYLPVDKKDIADFMRHILTVDEIHQIISDAEESENTWIEDTKQRGIQFEQLLSKGDRAEILWLVKVLSKYKRELEQKKFYASDAKILSAAEKTITEEFAFTLGISKDEVIPYVRARILGKNQGEEA